MTAACTGAVAITCAAGVVAGPDDGLETLMFRGARAALEAAGLDRADLDSYLRVAS